MGYRGDRFAVNGTVFTAATTLRSGIIHNFSTVGGAISQPLPAASSLLAADAFYVRRLIGTAALTVTPNGADTIDGNNVAITLYEGQAVLFVRSSSTGWRTFQTALGGAGPAMPFLDSGAALNVYVDGTNGSDANSGLSSGNALQTIPEVYRRFPWQMMGGTSILINLLNPSTSTQLVYTAGTINIGGGNTSLLCTYAFRGPEMIRATLTTGPSTAPLDAAGFAVRVNQAGAPSGSGNRTKLNFVTAAPGWTVNSMAGCFLRITRGAQEVINEVPICENTADSLTVDQLGIVGVVLNTDTVEICIPAVKISGLPGGPAGSSICTLIGRGEPAGDGPGSNYSTFERVAFSAVRAQGLGYVTFDRCLFDYDNGVVSRFAGWVVGFVNTASRSGVSLNGTQSGFARIRDPGTIDGGANLTELQVAPQPGQSCFGIAIGSHGVETFPQGPSTYVAIHSLSVYRASFGYPGIYVSGPGSFFQMTDGVPLNGAGNTGGGLRTTWGAISRINGGALSTLTGTSGDLSVTTGAWVAYGTGAGQFEQAAGWNGNLMRLALTATTCVGDTARITTSNVF